MRAAMSAGSCASEIAVGGGNVPDGLLVTHNDGRQLCKSASSVPCKGYSPIKPPTTAMETTKPRG